LIGIRKKTRNIGSKVCVLLGKTGIEENAERNRKYSTTVNAVYQL